ncbi:MAG TPA: hypothetical protein VJT69_12095 [Pyrinomonadaceae bacterium]|nr:hypothetical protein [Pyrinomonadaceae bacterium]
MRKNNCGVVRQELDELSLDEACSSSTAAHLRECGECREFQQQQTRLRQIVGSLGTVAAPADFDFRLRARLANDSNSASYLPIMRRGFALATVLAVFATGAFLVRNVWNRPATTGVASTGNQPAAVPESPKQVEPSKATQDNTSRQQLAVSNPEKHPQTVKNDRPLSTTPKSPRRLVAEDFSSKGATVISGQEAVSGFEVPLDASLQSFKVSLDDGRGNARTISVPTVSFGSERMLQTGNQFAPKRVW